MQITYEMRGFINNVYNYYFMFAFTISLLYLTRIFDQIKELLEKIHLGILCDITVYALFGKKRQSEKHFYCSEFVRYVLTYAGIDCSGISYYVPRPVEFAGEEWVKKLGAQIIYEGPLCEYPFYKETNDEKSQRVLKRVL